MPKSYQTPCIVARVDDIVAAALQLFIPEGRPSGSILWFVGRQDVPSATLGLLDGGFSKLRLIGLRKVYTTRNPFGSGWSGIADSWPHLLMPLQNSGIRSIRTPWVLYWHPEGPLKENSISRGYSLITKRTSTHRSIDIQLCSGPDRVGEAQIWFPAPECSSFVTAGVAELEWIEVSEDHRRQGLGSALLKAALREAREHGIGVLLLWTEVDNVAMRRMAARCGFVEGPVLHWFEIDL